MHSRRHSVICIEGIYFFLVLSFIVGAAMLRQINLLMVMAGMMIGLLIFNWRIALAMLNKLFVRRAMPQRVCAGDTFSVELIASLQRDFLDSWSLVIEDTVYLQSVSEVNASEQHPTQVQVLVPYVGVGQDSLTAYRCCLNHRGLYGFGPIRVSTRFPLGFVRASRQLDQRDVLVVCPAIGRLTAQWHRLMEGQSLGTHQSQRERGFVEGDYYGLRDWNSGDNRRAIHWRASAKLGDLIVCEYERQRNLDVSLILDLHTPELSSPRHLELVELVASFAATVVTDFCRRGGMRLDIAIAGAAPRRVSGAASALLMADALEAMATAQRTNANHLEALLTDVLRDAATTTRLVVVSTRAAVTKAELSAALADADPRVVGGMQRLKWIDVGSDELTRWFVPHESLQATDNHSPAPPVHAEPQDSLNEALTP